MVQNGARAIFRSSSIREDSFPLTSGTPVLAIVLVVASALCIIGASLTVIFSNNRSVGNWVPSSPAVQPSVLLSIFASIFRTCQVFLLSYGVTIQWWRTLNKGTKAKNLHYVWNKGEWKSIDGIKRAWNASSQTKWIMVVTIVVSVVNFGSGPLLQRSTRSVLEERSDSCDMNWYLPKKIPDGWVGTVDHTSPASLYASGPLQRILQDAYLNRTIDLGDLWVTGADISTCNGTCIASVVGPGLNMTCTSMEARYIDLIAPNNTNATLFSVDFNRTIDVEGVPVLNMNTLYTSAVDSSCNATLTLSNCEIRMATVRYQVVQQGLNLEPDLHPFPSVIEGDVSASDAPTSPQGLPAGALAGLEFMANYYLKSNATFSHNLTDDSMGFETWGMPALEYYDWGVEQSACTFIWTNPINPMFTKMSEVMFRLAATADSADGFLQYPTECVRVAPTLIYHSDFRFFGAVVGLMSIAFFCSLSLLWKYGDLDRQVTLSPLETGRVLACVMEKVKNEPDMEVEQLIQKIGDTNVQSSTEERASSEESRVGSISREPVEDASDHTVGRHDDGEDRTKEEGGGIVDHQPSTNSEK